MTTQLHKACGVCIYTLYMYVSMYIAVAVARFPRIPYTWMPFGPYTYTVRCRKQRVLVRRASPWASVTQCVCAFVCMHWWATTQFGVGKQQQQQHQHPHTHAPGAMSATGGKYPQTGSFQRVYQFNRAITLDSPTPRWLYSWCWAISPVPIRRRGCRCPQNPRYSRRAADSGRHTLFSTMRVEKDRERGGAGGFFFGWEDGREKSAKFPNANVIALLACLWYM